MTDFNLETSQLKEIAAAFSERVEDGLRRDEREIRCIPTYIPSIALPDSGEAYVLDLGGTNVRAAVISFENGKYSLKRGPHEAKMPWERNAILEKDIYLNTQATVLESLEYDRKCPLGYCFSYPAMPTLSKDAQLIKWTKEINVPGVVGKNVGEMLQAHLAQKFPSVKCASVTVVNDTVASLVAGLVKPPADAHIGLIVGTGTNMAAFIGSDHIPKLGGSGVKGCLPVNLESGNFHPPHLTPWDEIVDKTSRNPGEQRFEKAVSGTYLGALFKAVFPESDFDPETGAAGITALARCAKKFDDDYVLTAVRIYERSAKLVAASLAGLIMVLNSHKSVKTVRIVAEGSLFWSAMDETCRYPAITVATLKTLLLEFNLDDIVFEIEKVENANLIGSAVAALAP